MTQISKIDNQANFSKITVCPFLTDTDTPPGPDALFLPKEKQTDSSKFNYSPDLCQKFAFGSDEPDLGLTASEASELPTLIEGVISDSLEGYLYQNAIFYAERLYDLTQNYRSLHILAHCYVQSGDIDTACRLLRSYYPFFEMHLSYTLNEPSCIMKHGGFNESAVLNLPDVIISRWMCQYLYGICCCRTQRFIDAAQVLQELLRVSEQLLRNSESLKEEEETTGDIKRFRLKTDNTSTNVLGGTFHTSAAHSLYHHRIRQYLPGLLYWLGVASKQQSADEASSFFSSAIQKNPLLFCAFESYTKTVLKPKDSCVALFSAAYNEHAQMPGNSLARTQEEKESESREQTTFRGLFNFSERKFNILREFLKPFAMVTYLLDAFDCATAQRYIQNFPQNLAPTNNSPWRLIRYALSFFHEGDMRTSANIFAKMLKAAPWYLNDGALVLYSTALWQLKDERALAALSQILIEEVPLSAITLCVVANTYSLAKEHRQALVMLERAVLANPYMAYAYNLCGYEHVYLNQKKEAMEAFKISTYLDRHMYVAYAGLAEQHAQDGNIMWAQSFFKKAIHINPLPAVLNRYAATFHHHGAPREDLQKAYALYSKTISRQPQNLTALYERANLLILLGKTDVAYSQLLKLIQIYPNEAIIYISLANCVQLMGMRDKAIMYYQKAMTIDPYQEGYIKRCIQKLVSETTDEAYS